jgi:GT2 family glycosyltransferase
MLFSVVIPTHKRKEQLTALLNSLQEQTLDSQFFEVIVVSTENDEALNLNPDHWAFDLRIVTIKNDPFNGRSAAAKRNYGVELSHYPWIAFVDDDCIASTAWLESAKKEIEQHRPQMMEGGVHIPIPDKITFTYKGLLRLTQPGGYQTCNMFYKKEDFIEVGGFDLHLPFYLEDSDLAWTMIERAKKSIYCPEAQISHPVPPPKPQRILDHALRMEKLVYLYKKHPNMFKSSNKKVYPKAYKILVLADFFLIFSLFFCIQWLFIFLLLKLILTALYVFRLYKGSYCTLTEWTASYYYILFAPFIALVKMIQGYVVHRNI